MSAELGTVEDRSFSVAKFRLQNGSVMPTAKIAYETYGRLAAGGRSAPLITHGPTGCFRRRSPPGVMRDLAAAGVDARYFEIDSDLGHSGSGPEHAKWSPVLRKFLEPLMAQAA